MIDLLKLLFLRLFRNKYSVLKIDQSEKQRQIGDHSEVCKDQVDLHIVSIHGDTHNQLVAVLYLLFFCVNYRLKVLSLVGQTTHKSALLVKDRVADHVLKGWVQIWVLDEELGQHQLHSDLWTFEIYISFKRLDANLHNFIMNHLFILRFNGFETNGNRLHNQNHMLRLNLLSRGLYNFLWPRLPHTYSWLPHLRHLRQYRLSHGIIDLALPLEQLTLFPQIPLGIEPLDLTLNLLHLGVFLLLLHCLLLRHLFLQSLLHLHKAVDYLHHPVWEVDLHRSHRHDDLLRREFSVHRFETVQSLDINADITHYIDPPKLFPFSIVC